MVCIEQVLTDKINGKISALPHHGQASTMNNNNKPGTAFGTGRPSTGRTHAITIRISEKAFEYLCSVGNKSEYIDSLIKFKIEEDKQFIDKTHYIYYDDGNAAPFEVCRAKSLDLAKAWIEDMLKDSVIITADDRMTLKDIEESPLTARYEVYDGTNKVNPVYRSPFFWANTYK